MYGTVTETNMNRMQLKVVEKDPTMKNKDKNNKSFPFPNAKFALHSKEFTHTAQPSPLSPYSLPSTSHSSS
jgi:hypothetical protein